MPLVAPETPIAVAGARVSFSLGPLLLARADGRTVAGADLVVVAVVIPDGGGVFLRSLLSVVGQLSALTPPPSRGGGPLDVGSAAAGKEPDLATAPSASYLLTKVAPPELRAVPA